MNIIGTATETGLQLLKEDVKKHVKSYSILGDAAKDNAQLEAILTEKKLVYSQIEPFIMKSSDAYSCYYDESGQITFEIEIPYNTDENKYIYAIVLLGENNTILAYGNTPKIFKVEGVGGTIVYKVNVQGKEGEVIYIEGDYATHSLVRSLDEVLKDNIETHKADKANPHNVTKTQVGLSAVDNVKQYSASNPPPYPVTSVSGKTDVVVLSKNDVGLSAVDNVKQYSASNPPPYPVTSVSGKTGVVTLSKNDVGLSAVDNVKQYSASNPPPYPVTSVSGKTGAVVLSKSDVGLNAVDNTSDDTKVITHTWYNTVINKDKAYIASTNPGIKPEVGLPIGFSEYGTLFNMGGATYPVLIYIDLFNNMGIYTNHTKQWVEIARNGSPAPASDVYPWAKQASKPSYSYDEISGLVNYAYSAYRADALSSGSVIASVVGFYYPLPAGGTWSYFTYFVNGIVAAGKEAGGTTITPEVAGILIAFRIA